MGAAWPDRAASAAQGCSQPPNERQHQANPPSPQKIRNAWSAPQSWQEPGMDVWPRWEAHQPPGTASLASPQGLTGTGGSVEPFLPRGFPQTESIWKQKLKHPEDKAVTSVTFKMESSWLVTDKAQKLDPRQRGVRPAAPIQAVLGLVGDCCHCQAAPASPHQPPGSRWGV